MDFVAIIAILVSFGVPAAVIVIIANLRHKQRLEMISQASILTLPLPSL